MQCPKHLASIKAQTSGVSYSIGYSVLCETLTTAVQSNSYYFCHYFGYGHKYSHYYCCIWLYSTPLADFIGKYVSV